MKPISVLAAVASLAVLTTAAACKKDEPVTSETNTTGATVQPEQPATEPVAPPPVQPQVTTTTGSATDTTSTDQSGMRQSSGLQKGKDAGVASDFPSGGSDLIDRDTQYNKSNPNPGINPSTHEGSSQQGSTNAKQTDKNNHSTPLGDSKSGEYTGGKGTYGGKATWGTGPKKDTKMDQPQKQQ
jgi:hypothetical protein